MPHKDESGRVNMKNMGHVLMTAARLYQLHHLWFLEGVYLNASGDRESADSRCVTLVVRLSVEYENSSQLVHFGVMDLCVPIGWTPPKPCSLKLSS